MSASDEIPLKSQPEQIQDLVSELARVVDRFRAEYDLPLASVLGGFEMVKINLFMEETFVCDDDECEDYDEDESGGFQTQ